MTEPHDFGGPINRPAHNARQVTPGEAQEHSQTSGRDGVDFLGLNDTVQGTNSQAPSAQANYAYSAPQSPPPSEEPSWLLEMGEHAPSNLAPPRAIHPSLDATPSATATSLLNATWKEDEPTPTRRRWLAPVAGGAALVVIGLAGIPLLRSGSTPQPAPTAPAKSTVARAQPSSNAETDSGAASPSHLAAGLKPDMPLTVAPDPLLDARPAAVASKPKAASVRREAAPSAPAPGSSFQNESVEVIDPTGLWRVETGEGDVDTHTSELGPDAEPGYEAGPGASVHHPLSTTNLALAWAALEDCDGLPRREVPKHDVDANDLEAQLWLTSASFVALGEVPEPAPKEKRKAGRKGGKKSKVEPGVERALAAWNGLEAVASTDGEGDEPTAEESEPVAVLGVEALEVEAPEVEVAIAAEPPHPETESETSVELVEPIEVVEAAPVESPEVSVARESEVASDWITSTPTADPVEPSASVDAEAQAEQVAIADERVETVELELDAPTESAATESAATESAAAESVTAPKAPRAGRRMAGSRGKRRKGLDSKEPVLALDLEEHANPGLIVLDSTSDVPTDAEALDGATPSMDEPAIEVALAPVEPMLDSEEAPSIQPVIDPQPAPIATPASEAVASAQAPVVEHAAPAPEVAPDVAPQVAPVFPLPGAVASAGDASSQAAAPATPVEVAVVAPEAAASAEQPARIVVTPKPADAEVVDAPRRLLRSASEKDLAGIWAGDTIPLEHIGAKTRIATPEVGAARVVLNGGEIFEGDLVAVGEGSVWLQTKYGRMGLDGARVKSVTRISTASGPALNSNAAAKLAGLPRMRVKTPGGVLYGKLIERGETKSTLITESGARLVVDTAALEPMSTMPRVQIKQP